MKEVIGDECFKVLDQDIYILFYFGASWCKPCQKILPYMEELVKEYDEKIIQFYKIDIDLKENELLCDKCKIKVVPSFLLFKGRDFIDRTKGDNIMGVKQMIHTIFQEDDLEPEIVETKEDPFVANKQIFDKENLFK